MKILITTDLHVHNHLGCYAFIDNAEKYLEYLLKFCKEKGIKKIIITGDIFNCNHYINHVALLAVMDKLHDFKESGIDVVIVTGNHDLFNKKSSDRSLTQVFKRDFFVPSSYDKMDIVDGDATTRLHFYNYNSTIDKEKFDYLSGGSNILFSHLEINGFKMNTITVKDKIARTEFDKFDLVFNGHHHDYENIDNIVITGAPYHVNFGDVGKKRGFIVFDTISKEYSFERYSGADFVKLDPSKEINFDKVKGYYVRISYDKDAVEEKVILSTKRKLIENNYYVDVSHISKTKEKKQIDIEMDTFDDAYRDYISKFSKPNLDKQRLEEIFEQIKNSVD